MHTCLYYSFEDKIMTYRAQKMFCFCAGAKSHPQANFNSQSVCVKSHDGKPIGLIGITMLGCNKGWILVCQVGDAHLFILFLWGQNNDLQGTKNVLQHCCLLTLLVWQSVICSTCFYFRSLSISLATLTYCMPSSRSYELKVITIQVCLGW